MSAGDHEPDPALQRHALREAIGHCVYGVDFNALAVDLCKLALWLEAHEPGKPLGFLEDRIKHGNSLIGATRATMETGVPDAAFESVTGDDKPYAREIKRKNARERTGQMGLDATGVHMTHFSNPEALARYFAAMRTPDNDAETVRSKAEQYDRHRRLPSFLQEKLRADLWTAAFFWPLAEGAPLAPTHGVWSRLGEGRTLVDYVRKDGPPELKQRAEYATIKRAQGLAREQAFFHWELEFEEVFNRDDPGFDCILGNPPWERIKLQEQEFFAARDEEIATAPNAAARKRLIDALKTSPDEQKRKLHAEFEAAKRGSENESGFLRGSGVYPLTGRGDINTYSVFAELMSSRIRKNGQAGIIVPTGIATDDTNKHFFGSLMRLGQVRTFYSFENEERIFPGINNMSRFCLMTLCGHRSAATPDFLFFARRPEHVREAWRHFTLDIADLALLSPNTLNCPTFRSSQAAEITKHLYRVAPILVREGDIDFSPWTFSFKRMFDMATDSHLFLDRQFFVERSAIQDDEGNHLAERSRFLRLYEGKMVHQFDHRFGTYEGITQAHANKGTLPRVTNEQHDDPGFMATPEYWIDETLVLKSLNTAAFESRRWFLGYREITNAANERTLICSIIPWAAVGNKVPLMLLGNTATQAAALLGNLNSQVVDFAARQKVGSTSLSYFVVKQLPVLPPEIYTPALLGQIVPRVLELTYTAYDLTPFARDCGYDGEPFRWDPERRAHLRAELDGIYAHLYGLSRDDFAYILDTFPIVRRNDEKAHGEFRTKRLCLEAYDYFSEGALDALGLEMKRLEVGLRALLARTLGPGQAALPAAIREKVLARTRQFGGEAAAAAMAAAPLGSFLESCYLMELKAIVATSELWPRFAALFGEGRHAFESRFFRLNELRNALAHHRTIPDAARRQGETELAWFMERLESQ